MFFLTRLRRWWRDRSRNIFSYDDGVRIRYADPVAVGNDLEAALPDYQSLLGVLAQKTAEIPPGPMRTDLVQQQRDAIKKLSTAARTVFNLPKLDDQTGWGATDAHAIAVITEYFMFMEGLARKAELFQDSPEPESDSPPA